MVDYHLLLTILAATVCILGMFICWILRLIKEVKRRRRTEKALREKEHLLSDIIEFVPDATLVIDQQGKGLAWNRSMEEMTGIREEDILGKGDYAYAVPYYGKPKPILIDLAGRRPASKLEAAYDQVYRDGERLTAETCNVCLKGRIAWLRGSASALKDPHGEIVAAIESIRDVTADRYAEIELRRAKEEAEEAAQAKSEFLATMSHEIRTPMNAIINLTRLLLETPLDRQQRKYAEIAMTSSELLLSLINDILDFSKIEAGRLELEHTAFALEELLESVISPMRLKAEEKGLYLKQEIVPQMHLYFAGDPVRLQQILLNFLNNAIKFTEHGGITVRIASQEEKADRILLKITVSDTGIGIPQEQMKRLFHSFSQADASTSRKYGGTGLGLTICKRLSEIMGGQVGVASEQGKGSTFWFTVLVQKISADAVVSETRKSRLHGSLSFVPALLLVEDNRINQYVALSILKKFGLNADIAENGVQALEMLRQKEYDFVFMDIQMPEMDGFEAARRIRDPSSDVLRSDVPIVAMTADATKEDRDRCLAVGMNDYIPKPVNRERLCSVLQQQLGERKKTDREQEPLIRTAEVQSDSATDISLEGLPIFDRADLMDRLGGDEEGIDEFMADFPGYLSEDIRGLKTALREEDQESIRSCAHKIKGMCANASMERLREVCLSDRMCR